MKDSSSLQKSIEILSDPQDRPRVVCVMEDNMHFRRELTDLLIRRGFLVISGDTSAECRELFLQGCDIFVLDVDMGEGKPREGFKAMEAVRKAATQMPAEPGIASRRPICIIVTEHGGEQIAHLRAKLRPEAFFDKSNAGKEKLVKHLDAALVILRCQALAAQDLDPDTRKLIEEVCPPKLAAYDAERLLSQAIQLVNEIDHAVSKADTVTAAERIVDLDAILSELLPLHEVLGDGFGIVIGAMSSAVINLDLHNCSEMEWRAWLNVLEQVRTTPGISERDASRIASELDRAGFVTAPPAYRELAEALLNHDGKDFE